MQPNIILTNSSPTTAALQRETRTIPIVFGDTVAAGLVEWLNEFPDGLQENKVGETQRESRCTESHLR
jgi:hypothetical protein